MNLILTNVYHFTVILKHFNYMFVHECLLLFSLIKSLSEMGVSVLRNLFKISTHLKIVISFQFNDKIELGNQV